MRDRRNRYSSACRRKPAGPGQRYSRSCIGRYYFHASFRGEYDAVVTLYLTRVRLPQNFSPLTKVLLSAGGLPYAIRRHRNMVRHSILQARALPKRVRLLMQSVWQPRCPAGGEQKHNRLLSGRCVKRVRWQRTGTSHKLLMHKTAYLRVCGSFHWDIRNRSIDLQSPFLIHRMIINALLKEMHYYILYVKKGCGSYGRKDY